jgi:CheY-like chemotaxis protein
MAMRILVVDDDHSFASLLGRAIKRLGHIAMIVTHPDDAIEAFRDREIDAVITDIDMPGMSGIEMASTMRAEDPGLPLAFCSGTTDKAVLAEAATLGRILPKVWTIADVRDLILLMERSRPVLARGSQTGLPPRVPAPRASTPTPTVQAKPIAPPVTRSVSPPRPNPPQGPTIDASRHRVRKIKVTCHTWDQVERLCDQYAAGKSILTLRGSHRLRPQEKLIIALSLPDELVLSIGAEVASVRIADDGAVFSIQLTGMTPEMMAKIRSLVSAGQSAERAGSGGFRAPRASSPPLDIVREPRRIDFDRGETEADTPIGETPPVGAMLGNVRLRQQIDRLPHQLKRRDTTESD